MNAMHHGGYGEWNDKFLNGRVPQWYSLEIASIGGNVYFFIMTPNKFRGQNLKDLIEAQIYAQYPQAEVTEVPDYTEVVKMGGEDGWGIFGTEFKLKKADPYPIKTYIDYGVDRAVSLDENQKVDPITGIIETLGSIGDGEQLWIQILVRNAQKRHDDSKKRFGKKRAWTEVARDEIIKIQEKYKPKDKEKGGAPPPLMTFEDKNIVEALDRSMNKPGFDCGIRALYLAKKGKFRTANITATLNLFKAFGSESLNSFGPRNITSFDFPWQDYSGGRVTELKQEILDAYKARSFFYPPHDSIFNWRAMKKLDRIPFVLNSEELATIFHLPGGVSETPTFKRSLSKKSEPPINLPV